MYKQLLYITLTAALLAAGCSPEEEASTEDLVKKVNVETERAEPESFDRFLKLVGSVKSQNDVQISAEVSGRVNEYYVEQGDRIKKGEPILKIDDSQLIQERERLEAVTAQSRENFQRLKRLYEQDSVGSEMDFLNARYNYEQNRAALEAVKINIEKTTVTAPFDARLEQKIIEEGEMANIGAVLVRLIGSDRLRVVTGVPSGYSDVVEKGDMARVWFDYQNSDTLQLPISFVGKSIDTQTRTFEVEARLPAGGNYKIDMIANMMVRTLELENVIVLGSEYVIQTDEENIVYTVAKNAEDQTIAKAVPVKLGAAYKNEVVIEDGLEPGDEIITVGSSFLQDSMRISVLGKVSSGVAKSNQ